MIKRTALALPLIVAGLLFLANGALSHHHHGDHICYHHSHCQGEEPSDGDSEEKGRYRHHDNDNQPCSCQLDEPVLLFTERLSGPVKVPDNRSCQSAADHSGYLLPGSQPEAPVSEPLCCSVVIPDSDIYNLFTGFVPGLRSPPSV